MTDEIKVSVICAAFNHEKYIRQTLESFVAQKTDFKFEVIVTDDASTDSTAQIIREMAAMYPEIIKPIFFTENQWNQGIYVMHDYACPAAKGKYLAYCEGDDYWTDENKLQLQADFLDAHPDYSACVHNTQNLYCKTGERLAYNKTYDSDRDLSLEDVIYSIGGVFHTSSVMTLKELELNLPKFYYVSTYVGDHPRAIWFALNGKIRYINKTMSVYRINSTPTAWSSRMNDNYYIIDRLKGAVAMYKALVEFMGEGHKDIAIAKKALLRDEFELLQALGEFDTMKAAPYDVIYKEKPFKQRAWITFKQKFPGLYKLYLKARGRESQIPEKLLKKKSEN